MVYNSLQAIKKGADIWLKGRYEVRDMENKQIIARIAELKAKRKAIILAHLYQPDEIQEIVDFTGDSLELSRKAALTAAETIVFCGVKFMAETAKILSPQKTVLLPDLNVGCYLADTITDDDVRRLKEENPDAVVVCYVNSSAAVKAESDYCCTSSNAIELIRRIPEKKIIFIPDGNLGKNIANQVPEKEFVFWGGYCDVHDIITVQDVEMARKTRPQAEILVHPECRPEVVALVDFAGSTAHILERVRRSSKKEFVIGTEQGILFRLKKENPEKSFALLREQLVCEDMKKIGLQDVYAALAEMKHETFIEPEIQRRAAVALNRMLS